MTQHKRNFEADRLKRLSEEVSRIATSLAKLSLGPDQSFENAEIDPDPDVDDVSEETVRWLIKARGLRSRFLPSELFADPAWDILLELLRAEIAHERIAVSSLCIAANVPSTTALRCINTMVNNGQLRREKDLLDGRRVYVALTPEMSKALRIYCVNVFKRPLGK